MTSTTLTLLVILLSAEGDRPWTSPKSAAPEYGHGLEADEALAGWISLFDGETTFGWTGARLADGLLENGQSTNVFPACELRVNAVAGGQIKLGSLPIDVKPGVSTFKFEKAQPGVIRLGSGVKIKSLLVRPIGLQSLFNGNGLAGWKPLPHPRLPVEKQTRWEVADGAIRGTGGPGGLELQERQFGDLVLQVVVRTRAKLTNGGVFIRAIPRDFMNGYELQVFNACYDRDPAQPAKYSTGAIDDRQLARRLVSRDEEPFLMTILAVGPHLATWVNGAQMTDWTDTRAEHENPRQGLRLKAGALQLQAHDPDTQIEFRKIEIAEIK